MVKVGGKESKRASYGRALADISGLIVDGRRAVVRAVNATMTATYWLIGRRIFEEEQRGLARAGYGEELVLRLARDLSRRSGRGFGARNLFQMRAFYLAWPQRAQSLSARSRAGQKVQTLSAQSRAGRKVQTLSAQLRVGPTARSSSAFAAAFPLPWSHYVQLLAVDNVHARAFYEAEALRGGWTVRQLARQIGTQFYERTALSRNKLAMLKHGERRRPGEELSPRGEIKDAVVLEFLDLKDEYAESDFEEALVRDLETFLLELGGDFSFVGRQRRLRIGDDWYRVDLLFFHRRLRCLVVIDLKLSKLTHADAGQMHMYLNYARRHWMVEGENPPVGLILCASGNASVAEYALEGLANKVMTAEYRTRLPSEGELVKRIERTQRKLLADRRLASALPTATAAGTRSPRRARPSRRPQPGARRSRK